jgi:hypothetical protein
MGNLHGEVDRLAQRHRTAPDAIAQGLALE